ncbi:MAG: ribonuclease D [Acidimicrobiales bacterium]|jgi:ribonuclease D
MGKKHATGGRRWPAGFETGADRGRVESGGASCRGSCRRRHERGPRPITGFSRRTDTESVGSGAVAPLITDAEALEEVVEQALQTDVYAIDTEFHRERTYFPQVALVQLAWNDQVVLIDPLSVDIRPMGRLLDGPGLCLLHAASQDLEVLELATGSVPTRMFDTQIAAGFLGIATGSLASLLDSFLGVTLTKGDRLTDWLRRPLTDDQLRYAAADVDNLIQLCDVLTAKLEERGRLGWAESESQLLLERPRGRRPPEEAVHRIKEARSLKGETARIAQAVAAWRERRAADLDLPVRQVLPDIAVVAVSQQKPTAEAKLLDIRGLDKRHTRDGAGAEILTAIQVGKNTPADTSRSPRQPELPKDLRPVVTLVTSWVSQLARDHKLDPAILATRNDVETLLRNDLTGRLSAGWRADLVGEPIRQLVDGKAALAFEDGRLVLETRSGEMIANSSQ